MIKLLETRLRKALPYCKVEVLYRPEIEPWVELRVTGVFNGKNYGLSHSLRIDVDTDVECYVKWHYMHVLEKWQLYIWEDVWQNG